MIGPGSSLSLSLQHGTHLVRISCNNASMQTLLHTSATAGAQPMPADLLQIRQLIEQQHRVPLNRLNRPTSSSTKPVSRKPTHNPVLRSVTRAQAKKITTAVVGGNCDKRALVAKTTLMSKWAELKIFSLPFPSCHF